MINDKRRWLLLALISAAASLTMAIFIIGLSYLSAIDNTYLRLQETVHSQARLIEAMANHERARNPDQGSIEYVLDAVKAAHESYEGFGDTGEFALASLEGGQIRILVQQRVQSEVPADFIASDVTWAAPMKRALNGESGTMLARDYRGHMVLAAYESVNNTSLGLVAKIDRMEIVRRFIPAAGGSVAIAIFVAFGSAFLFVRLGDPIAQRLRAQKKSLRISVASEKRVATNLRHREEQQRAIAELGTLALQGISLEELYSRTVSKAANLLGVEYAKILELRPARDDLLLKAGIGWHTGLVGTASVPASGHSQAAYTLKSGAPVVVENISEERRFSGPQLLSDHNIQSGISVVIGRVEKPWGVLGVHANQPRSFDEADIFFVQALAGLLSNAIKRSFSIKELRKWNLLFQHAGWGMAVIDSSTDRFIGVNPAFAVMHGYTMDQAQTKSPGDYLATGQDDLLADVVGMLGDKHGATYEVKRVRKDGSVFPAVVNEVAVYDDQGDELYRVANVQDVSERNRVEAERLSVDRKVQHAQKLESLGVLAGGIAHDFNNILMTILGNASIALLDLGPEALARTSVEAIETAARQAAALAKQMLAYSGKGQFVVENMAINKLVKEMTHLLEVTVAKNVILRYSFGPNLPLMRGDAAQISQILMNLIINASDAIGEKSGSIHITTGAMQCDREYLDSVSLESSAGIDAPLAEGLYNFFSVSDTGCGMDADTIARIFDPFFTTKFAGRGLGLAAMLGIVRAHRGAIKICSEVGKGSTFKILLPAAADAAEANEAEERAIATPTLWRGEGVVLIVDDDESIISLGKKMLDRLGYTALAARDGIEAVEMYRENESEIACVILDLTMPRMSGADAFEEIRRVNSEAKVILCSGYDEQQVTQEFAGKGLAGFLHKPYTLTELKKKMKEILG